LSTLPGASPVVMHPVQADGLVLEPQQAAHAAELFPVLCDPALYAFENEPPESEAWLAARYARLESRRSADATELWLNWVIRLEDGAACGFVQATVLADRRALIAYVLGSPWWGRGIARTAVSTLLDELESHWGVHHVLAVLQAANLRSAHLLERLGFGPATPDPALDAELEPGERRMERQNRPA
jgi:ribosomal-protein-alanine N-acetyltransferase